MNNLKDLRIAKNYTQTEIADYLGISSQAYGYYESDKRQMSIDTVRKLSSFFNVPITLIIGDNDFDDCVESLGVKVPVVGQISAGLPILATQFIEDYEFAPTKLIKQGHQYFYLRVKGDSMNMLFQNGNIVLIEQCPQIEDGEVGAFLIDDENATVKKFHKQNGLVILNPMSTNPIHQPQIYDPRKISIKCIGKVLSYQGYMD